MNRQVSIFEEVNDQGEAVQVVTTMTFHDRLLDIYR